jgi:hypothetical protein
MKMRMGKRAAALAACVALAAAFVCASCKKDGDSSAAGGAPKIAAVEAKFDFGKVKQGQAVEHVFKIKNNGTAELKIEKAKGS